MLERCLGQKEVKLVVGLTVLLPRDVVAAAAVEVFLVALLQWRRR
jgi:hypothetical protein